MRQAAKLLTGEHDYKSFCNVRTQVLDTVRTVYSIDIEKDSNDVITIRVRGNGFLYNMVRILAGTLMAEMGVQTQGRYFHLAVNILYSYVLVQ